MSPCCDAPPAPLRSGRCSAPPRCLASAAMEHPNATFARNLYAALAAGDVATAFDALAHYSVGVNLIVGGTRRAGW